MTGRGRIIGMVRCLVLLTGLALLAGCMPEPYLPGYGYGYTPPPPMPPPLQPYVEPAVPPAAAVSTPRRTVKRRHIKRHRYHQALCPCRGVQ